MSVSRSVSSVTGNQIISSGSSSVSSGSGRSSSTVRTGTGSNGYLSAVQKLLNTNQERQNKQLSEQEARQRELLELQRRQLEKANQNYQDSQMIRTETSSKSYTNLLKELLSLSQRNTALNTRIFS